MMLPPTSMSSSTYKTLIDVSKPAHLIALKYLSLDFILALLVALTSGLAVSCSF